MLYYYAHTGHKVGLERLRRGIALKHALQKHDIDMQMLVNDFRAGVALKDEQGLSEYITIETIQDIDAVAQMGDSVIIDSDEDDHGRLVKYVADFKQVWRFAHDEADRSIHGEVLFRVHCQEESCEEAILVDEYYFQKHEKAERTLFFLGDHDHQKHILKNPAFFEESGMELLLGHYFFVKYEDELAKCFTVLHEAETYPEVLSGSKRVVTASSQAAMEAKASGADVMFMQLDKDPLYPVSVLKQYGIAVMHGMDKAALERWMSDENRYKEEISIKKIDLNHILKKL
jgi:hypothetical protein